MEEIHDGTYELLQSFVDFQETETTKDNTNTLEDNIVLEHFDGPLNENLIVTNDESITSTQVENGDGTYELFQLLVNENVQETESTTD